MRVLMLTSSYPKFRGDTTAPFIESIATHIAAQGIETHVVLPEHRELQRGAVEDSVHFHPYRYALKPEWTLWGYAEALRADVKLKRGVYALAPFAVAASFQKMMQLTARTKFDLVHAHWVLPNAPAAALAAQWRQLPLVISMHGSDVFMAEKNRAFGSAARWCFDRAAWLTACSDELMQRALALGAAENKTELIPYGADAKIFHVESAAAQRVRAQWRLRDDDVMILAVGRMVYKKGFEFLIAALPEILARAPHARLVLVGYGDLRDALEQQAHALGLNGSVTFAGRVPRQEIPAYFGASDVVVVPSVRDEAGNVDGLPNVVLEGMAAGKAIVASNIAGFPDVIRDGESGLLVPEKDSRALADAITKLAADASLRAQLGARARAEVRARLNWENVAKRFIRVYERVAKSS
jgi:glycosyltransferase involved in cell wall biosynthesis